MVFTDFQHLKIVAIHRAELVLHRNQTALIRATTDIESFGELRGVVVGNSDLAHDPSTLELENVLKLRLEGQGWVEPVVLPEVNHLNTEAIAGALCCSD